MQDQPAGTQYNRRTKLDDFAKVLTDFADGELPTQLAESALRELLDSGDTEMLVHDFNFLVRTLTDTQTPSIGNRQSSLCAGTASQPR